MSDALAGHPRLHGQAKPKGNDCPRKWPCCSEADKGGCDLLICHIDPECFGEGLDFQAAKELITSSVRQGIKTSSAIM